MDEGTADEVLENPHGEEGGSGAFGALMPLLGLGAAGYGLTGGNFSRLGSGTFWRDTAQRLF